MVMPSEFDGKHRRKNFRPRKTPPQVTLDNFELFSQSETFSEAIERFEELSNDCHENKIAILYELRKNTKNWKGLKLLDQLTRKSENGVYFTSRRAAHSMQKGNRVAYNQNCLIVGAGPCGLRTAIEMAFLGADVTVVDSRKEFSRNNVLHLWPFCISDLKSLGAKSFYGKFCTGAIDHCSIRRLQMLLVKVCLLLGVKFEREVYFESIEPDNKGDWRISVKPQGLGILNNVRWDCVVDATGGSANTASPLSPDLSRKEFRGLLAIGITVNFVNSRTQAETSVEEISGVASIYKQHFFAQLRKATGIDLENIVYYKDDTHYFVMTARTKSLFNLGVLKKVFEEPARLLDRSNIDPQKLQEYAMNAANFATQYKLPELKFAENSRGNPDVSIFDFTSRYHSRYAAVVRRTKKSKILGLLVGDALINPFWPTGTGIGKGFLGVFDACWTFRQVCLGQDISKALQDREVIYKHLDQCDPSTLNKKIADYTIDPKTRYTNFSSTNRNVSAEILFVEETKGKRKSCAPIKSEPNKKRSNCGNTLKDQERIILNWLNSIITPRLLRLGDICWKNGDLLLNIIQSVRPDLIDKDTIVGSLTPLKKTELAITIAKTYFSIEPLGSPEEFLKTDPDKLLILTYLTQIQDNINNAPSPRKRRPRHNVKFLDNSTDKIRSPKKSLEEKLTKLTETLRRKSAHVEKKDICPFCDQRVFVAERYGADGFWFHRKCFKCTTCQQMLVFSGGNYREIDSNYYCQSCAPINKILTCLDKQMTDPEKEEIVNNIIEKTNVPKKPVPMPRTKFIKPVQRSESLKVISTTKSPSAPKSQLVPRSPICSKHSSHGLSDNISSVSSRLILSDGGSSCDSESFIVPTPSFETPSMETYHNITPDTLNGDNCGSQILPIMTSTKSREISSLSSPSSNHHSMPLENMSADDSVGSSLNAFEEETISKWDHAADDTPSGSLPKFNHLESLKSRNSSLIKHENASQEISSMEACSKAVEEKKPKRRESKIHHARVTRPVTWYGHDNNSADEDDDIHEAEQIARARQLKAQSVQRSLEEVAVRQIEIEQESVKIEKEIRLGRPNSNELMNNWFDLVKEKNRLLRHENKLMIEQRELQLQDHQQTIAATIRERLKLPDHEKTEESKTEDEILERVRNKKTQFYIRYIERGILR